MDAILISKIAIALYVLFVVLNVVVIVWDLRIQYRTNGESVRELGELIAYVVVTALSAFGSFILFVKRRDALSHLSRKFDFSLTAWVYKDITVFKRKG